MANTADGPNQPDAQLNSLRYNEATGVVTAQRDALGELRSRTGLLISAATISTSFLGSVGAKGRHGFPLEFLWALIPFGISIGLALAILVPWRGWRFSLRSESFEAYKGTPFNEVLVLLAAVREKSAIKNQFKINLQ
jgi:hypothetical protein